MKIHYNNNNHNKKFLSCSQIKIRFTLNLCLPHNNESDQDLIKIKNYLSIYRCIPFTLWGCFVDLVFAC